MNGWRDRATRLAAAALWFLSFGLLLQSALAEEQAAPGTTGPVQERGVTPKVAPFKAPEAAKILPAPSPPRGCQEFR
jgi:hypothetical protein